MSYVYIRSEPALWTVGFYRPDGKWEPESDHNDREDSGRDEDAGQLAEVRALLAAFDWERDDRQYALEQIEMIVSAEDL